MQTYMVSAIDHDGCDLSRIVHAHSAQEAYDAWANDETVLKPESPFQLRVSLIPAPGDEVRVLSWIYDIEDRTRFVLFDEEAEQAA